MAWLESSLAHATAPQSAPLQEQEVAAMLRLAAIVRSAAADAAADANGGDDERARAPPQSSTDYFFASGEASEEVLALTAALRAVRAGEAEFLRCAAVLADLMSDAFAVAVATRRIGFVDSGGAAGAS